MTTIQEFYNTSTSVASQAASRIESFTASALSYMNQISGVANTIPFTYLTPSTDVSSPLYNYINSNVDSTASSTSLAQAGTAAPYTTISAVSSGNISVPNVAAPSVNIPTAPTLVYPTLPTEPTLSPVTTPNPPVLTEPSLPSLISLNIPTFGGYNPPSFIATAPTPINTFTDNAPIWGGETIDQTQFVEASNWFQSILVNGGTGLHSNDETRLLWLAEDTASKQAEATSDELSNAYQLQGYILPNGVVSAQIRKSREQAAFNRNQARQAWAGKMADLASSVRQFAADKTIQYMGVIYQFQNSINERLFQWQKILADWGISRYNLELERSKILWSGYETYAKVYETQIRAEVEKINAFKAQLEAEQTKTNINESQVRLYTAQFAALETKARLYIAEMQGAEIKAKLQQLLLEQFRTQVEAYKASLEAQQTKVNIYNGLVKTEETKVAIAKQQVDAYKAVADAAKDKAQVDLENNKNQLEAARLQLQAWEAQYKQLRDVADVAIANRNTQVQEKGVPIQIWRSRMDGWTNYVKLQESMKDMQFKQAEIAARINVENAKTRAGIMVQGLTSGVSVNAEMAKVYANIIGGAYSGLNASLSSSE